MLLKWLREINKVHKRNKRIRIECYVIQLSSAAGLLAYVSGRTYLGVSLLYFAACIFVLICVFENALIWGEKLNHSTDAQNE